MSEILAMHCIKKGLSYDMYVDWLKSCQVTTKPVAKSHYGFLKGVNHGL